MGGVATANDHGFFPLGIWLGSGELARMDYPVAFEIIEALNIRGNVCFTRVASSLYYMTRVESAC